MTQARVYLDHNATSPLRPESAEAMMGALALHGNPSAVHAEGRQARAAIEAAREEIAALAGVADPRLVTFTSGATEALNLVLQPTLRSDRDPRPFDVLLMPPVEHAAVSNGHRFGQDRVRSVPVPPDGVADLDALSALVAELSGARALLALQAANNETGVVQPVRQAARVIHAAGGMLVCDATPAAARIAVDFATLDADCLVFSAHKLGGPAGIGALIRTSQEIHLPEPLLRGGRQERGLRAGTENLSGIVGFGVAVRLALVEREREAIRLSALRERLEAGLRATDPGTVVFGAGVSRLPNTSAFASRALTAEMALIGLDLEGIAVSSGSACSSGKVKASHVLDAMGVAPDLRKGMIRISLGWTTQEADIDRLLAVWSRLHQSAATRVAA